ncbi:MAG TPA: adenylate/guanylate cyclase domain-containing protein [Pseudonocardia sp.]
MTEQLFDAPPRYTYAQAAVAAGMDPDRAVQLWQSMGLTTPAHSDELFTEVDVQALRLAGLLTEQWLAFGADLATARAWAQAMARLSEWQVDMLRHLAETEVADHADPADAEASVLDAAARLLPLLDQLQQYVWRRHLLASTDRLITTISRSGESAPRVVGFADIVGFTDLSRGLTDRRLAEFVEDFEARTSAVVTRHRGRVIKMIGDEIMFEADDPDQAADIALELAVMRSSLDDRPNLHVGMAYGPVLHQFGDAFGTVVNLTSRLTSLARPGSVLADTALATALADDSRYTVHELRSVAMRGFDRVRPWLLRSPHHISVNRPTEQPPHPQPN